MRKTTRVQFARLFVWSSLISLVLAGCNLPTGPSQPTTTAPTVSIEQTVAAMLQTVIPTASPTLENTPTPLPTSTPTVTATAVIPISGQAPSNNGLGQVIADKSAANIRRGPGLEYNLVGGLLKGATTDIYGRDQSGNWLYVAIPNQPGQFGWVTSLSAYVTVAGNIQSLPLQGYTAAVPAYLQNCTPDIMLVQFGNMAIPPASSKPDNILRFNPNYYKIFDEKYKNEDGSLVQVLSITLQEGQTIQITTDGKGKNHTCS
jgi:uncharacterized protein YgiM (DUF1202 family)